MVHLRRGLRPLRYHVLHVRRAHLLTLCATCGTHRVYWWQLKPGPGWSCKKQLSQTQGRGSSLPSALPYPQDHDASASGPLRNLPLLRLTRSAGELPALARRR